MNLCLWFFGLVEFLEVSDVFFWGGRIPPERPRINTGQSGGLGDGSPQWGPWAQPQWEAWGRSPPEAEAFCTLAHNVLKNGYRKYIDIICNKKMNVDIYGVCRYTSQTA